MGVVGCDTGTWTPFCPDARGETRGDRESSGKERRGQEKHGKMEERTACWGYQERGLSREAGKGVAKFRKRLTRWIRGLEA